MRWTSCNWVFSVTDPALRGFRLAGSVALTNIVAARCFSSQRRTLEILWRELFSDPSKWWDYRPGKASARHPDFKHKETKEALWIDGKLNPPWVEAQLAKLSSWILQSNIFQWNEKLRRCVKAGQCQEAIDLFRQLQQEEANPNRFTFVPVLNACANLQALEEGRHVHTKTILNGCETDLYVGSSLIDMYAKCGSIEDAFRVFKKIPKRNVVSWNAMILGLVKCGQGQKALELSQQMKQEQVEPIAGTFVAMLNACASVGALDEGRKVHEEITQRGFQSNVFVSSSLVSMYAKCGSIDDAKNVFDKMLVRDGVAWSAMIMGFTKCGQAQKALELSCQMKQEGIEPDPVTLVGILNACASALAIEKGRKIHEQIIQRGLETDVFVGSSLIDMYAKCGTMSEAWEVFDKISNRNVVSWNAMIMGYVKSGQGQKALELSQQMLREGIEPVPGTFVGLLNACASVAALEAGKFFHKQIIEMGYESDVFVGSCLVDMYAKCGSIEDARRVFRNIPTANAVASSAMLGGYAMHGHANEALTHFEEMCQAHVEVDRVSFVSLLSVCSHAGLVDEGLHLFRSMSYVYGLSATVEHSACMVDLLGRAGHLHEAKDLVKMMSCEPNTTLWMALLGACRAHGNVEMGKFVAKCILELDPGNLGGCVLLSNIYAAAGMLDSREIVQQQRLESPDV